MFKLGERLGPYELIALLSSGGMGMLFLGRVRGAAGFERTVAIKAIHPHLACDAQFVRMFVDEARLASRIQHPNVVHIEELGEVQGRPFMVMEYVAGCSLAQLLARLAEQHGRIPPAVAVQVAVQLCGALHAAHTLVDPEGQPLELVHRDVSPQNVLLGWTGNVKLIDFGVCKARERVSHTEAGLVKGKRGYMAPEQMEGESIDGRSDLYSLGVILWEMLTGRRLFGEGAAASVSQPSRIPRPSTSVAGLPTALDSVVTRLLAPRREDRFATARELRDALAQALPEALLGGTDELESLLRETMGDAVAKERALLDASPSHPQPVASGLAREAGDGDGPLPSSVSSRGRMEPTIAEGVAGLDPLATPQAILARYGTSFVGREGMLARIEERLAAGARVVTLFGPGGIGKTRLALELAARRPGPVLVAELAEVLDVHGLCEVVARRANVHLSGPSFSEEAITRIGRALSEMGPVLVILDNCEQIVEPARETITAWLALAPEAVFVVTSRCLLRTGPEVACEVGPLSLPEGEDAASEAVTLLLDRIARIRPEYVPTDDESRVLTEIAALLDGIPLAIELAAPRVAVLGSGSTLEQLARSLEFLSDAPRSSASRHRTLRAAIEWSWNMLDPVERDLLQQCSVFRGGFTLPCLEQVAELGADGAPSVSEVLQSLRESSLVAELARDSEGAVRFRLLVPIRQFAGERLADAGEETAAYRRHADHFAALAVEWAARQESSESASYCARMARDWENLLQAVETALRDEEDPRRGVETALKVLLACAEFRRVRGGGNRYWSLLDRALEHAGDLDLEPRLRALALAEHAIHHHRAGRTGAAQAALDGALALLEPYDLPREKGRVHRVLSIIALDRCLHQTAAERLELALAHSRRAGDSWTEGRITSDRAFAYFLWNRVDEAIAGMEQALSKLRANGDRLYEGVCHCAFAYCLLGRGEVDEAVHLLKRGLARARAFESGIVEAKALGFLAIARHMQGRRDEASSLYERTDRVLYIAGDGPARIRNAFAWSLLSCELGDHDEALRRGRRAYESAVESGHPDDVGLSSLWMAALEALSDRPTDARVWWRMVDPAELPEDTEILFLHAVAEALIALALARRAELRGEHDAAGTHRAEAQGVAERAMAGSRFPRLRLLLRVPRA